jgi:hypothetical protein
MSTQPAEFGMPYLDQVVDAVTADEGGDITGRRPQ